MLVKDEFNGERFGIRYGQIRHHERVHNGGWYNAIGEKLGWGDLDDKDIIRISKELAGDDVFVVLPESCSHWDFLQRFEDCGGGMVRKVMDPKEEAPGIEYLCKHCYLVILPGDWYWVSYDPINQHEVTRERATEIIMERGGN
jgi:hypothetical protein